MTKSFVSYWVSTRCTFEKISWIDIDQTCSDGCIKHKESNERICEPIRHHQISSCFLRGQVANANRRKLSKCGKSYEILWEWLDCDVDLTRMAPELWLEDSTSLLFEELQYLWITISSSPSMVATDNLGFGSTSSQFSFVCNSQCVVFRCCIFLIRENYEKFAIFALGFLEAQKPPHF